MKIWTGIIAASTLALGSAYAHTVQYSAVLDGPSEAPANASPGVGTALVTFDYDLVTMRVEASFSGLTGNVTASHIHGPTTVAGTGTAGVMTVTPTFTGFPSGVTAGTYDHTFDMTLASSYNPSFVTAQGGVSGALNALTAALDGGKAYLNIHTSTFSGGEIRGFLTVVPEPASMTGLALAGLILRRRR
jgi:hypothetical protein